MYLEANERANRAALILVQEEWASRFSTFVKKDQTRLAYIQSQLDDMIRNVVDETGAEFPYVKSRFDAYLADAVAVSEPESVDVTDLGEGDSYPGKFGDPAVDGIVTVDLLGNGAVLVDEAYNPDAKIDLNEDTQKVTAYEDGGDIRDESTWKDCFRCSAKLNPVYAQTSPVCKTCTTELLHQKEADLVPATTPGSPAAPPGPGVVAPENPDQLFKCTICGRTGTIDEINQHVQQDHQDVLQNQQNGQIPTQTTPQPNYASLKNSDVNDPAGNVPPEQQDVADTDAQTDPGVQDDADKKPIDVDPQDDTPADKFDTYIQDIANHAAAQQFSQADESEIQNIASTYGIDPETVRANLQSTATFGDFTAVNGDLSKKSIDHSGLVEIPDIGGRVESHEALVPVEIAVRKVADEMNMEENLVYDMVKDRYGADLPDKYHASVSGEHHFYLPENLIGNNAPQDESGYDPTVGPTPQPTPPTSRVALTFRQVIEQDKARAAEQKKLYSA